MDITSDARRICFYFYFTVRLNEKVPEEMQCYGCFNSGSMRKVEIGITIFYHFVASVLGRITMSTVQGVHITSLSHPALS
jgi:hypothetical protein